MTRRTWWVAALCSLCVATMARAEEKSEPAGAPSQEAAPSDAAKPNDTESAQAPPSADTANEPAAAATAGSAQQPSGPDAEPAQPSEPAPAPAEQPARPDAAAAQKAPAAKAPQGPFQASWQEASADEKALFLEAFGESSKALQERWDKASPEERRKILRAHPLLGARTLKQRWVAATPEERAAFLETSTRTVQKVREAWDSATPEQRKLLALEHPYFARKAFHHAWTQATPQEKLAFLVGHPQLHGELKARWSGATAWQKQWYARNYPGLESLANARPWAQTTTEERALFLEANPAIGEKIRDAWQKTPAEARAAIARKWQGWPLKQYQPRLENAGKTMISAKTKTPGPAKGPARPPHK